MKKRYNITLDPDIHDKGVKQAIKERRSFSDYIEGLIIKKVSK
jgi:predicted CopG family antitoxin